VASFAVNVLLFIGGKVTIKNHPFFFATAGTRLIYSEVYAEHIAGY
jgi:hypothetical protein